jgi:hypothetical protein
VFSRELSHLASVSPNTIEITWLPQGLHDHPDIMRNMIASALEELERQSGAKLSKHNPDAVALGYGLCSNGIVGLSAGRVPLVAPRTDDCIALFLGSQARYEEEFKRLRGCYWLNSGWVEYGFLEDAHISSSAYVKNKRGEYAEKYGEENADFLIEYEMSWIEKYSTCAYISSPVYNCAAYCETAMRYARENGWAYESLDGSLRLMEKLVGGDWNDDEFLVVPPGRRIAAAYDGTKIMAE